MGRKFVVKHIASKHGEKVQAQKDKVRWQSRQLACLLVRHACPCWAVITPGSKRHPCCCWCVQVYDDLYWQNFKQTKEKDIESRVREVRLLLLQCALVCQV